MSVDHGKMPYADVPAFEIVVKPSTFVGSIDPDLLKAIVSTVDSENAVKVNKIEGTFLTWQGKMRNVLRKHGYKLKFRRVKRTNEVYLWAERLPEGEFDPIEEIESDEDVNDEVDAS